MEKLIGFITIAGGQALPEQDKTITPNETLQTVEADDGYMLGQVNINPIPSNYGSITNTDDILSIS